MQPVDPRNPRNTDPNLDEPRGAAWASWWWIWFVIFIILIFWFAGWGWWGYGGWGWGYRGHARNGVVMQNYGGQGNAAGMRTANTVRASVPEILSSSKAMEGQRVFIPNARVETVNGKGTLLVGPSQSQTMLVAAAPGVSVPNIAQGQTVQVTGTVEGVAGRNVQQTLGIPASQAQQIQNQGIYLLASNISTGGNGNNMGQNGSGNSGNQSQ